MCSNDGYITVYYVHNVIIKFIFSLNVKCKMYMQSVVPVLLKEFNS